MCARRYLCRTVSQKVWKFSFGLSVHIGVISEARSFAALPEVIDDDTLTAALPTVVRFMPALSERTCMLFTDGKEKYSEES